MISGLLHLCLMHSGGCRWFRDRGIEEKNENMMMDELIKILWLEGDQAPGGC